MKLKPILLASAILVPLVSSAASGALANVIYQESFGGAGGLLDTTTTDAVGFGASATWSANSFALDNGTIDGAAEGSAILPFNSTGTFGSGSFLQAGGLYHLEMTVNIVTGVAQWVGLGLTDAAGLGTPGGSSAIDRFSNSGGRGWMLIRDDATVANNVQFFKGANTAGGVDEAADAFGADFNTVGGSYGLRLIYDTTAGLATSTATLQIDSGLGYATLISNAAVNLSNVKQVGYTYDNTTTTPPSVSNFSLTTNIPEPSAVLLGGMGLLGLLRRRRN